MAHQGDYSYEISIREKEEEAPLFFSYLYDYTQD